MERNIFKMVLLGTNMTFLLLLPFAMKSMSYHQKAIKSITFIGLAMTALDATSVFIPGKKLSGKILFFTICFFGSCSMAIWNAGLTSQLTIEKRDNPIQNINGNLKTPEVTYFLKPSMIAESKCLQTSIVPRFLTWGSEYTKFSCPFVHCNSI